ncbi:hypothetical protein [Sphingomonas sp.]|uniref:hypothetical protein n=1 Tax=Sphingomonas sp. TaxID=28214 RepID=UPI0017AE5AF2|nr:hypothetical protein [Sphingomonas sp.]MBA3510507.1 hypothetical protein [Sphingomonas sp.]
MKLVPRHHDLLLYQHAYSGGYDEYRREQIKWNRAKIDSVWADRDTLAAIAADIRSNKIAGRGLCHGARNGFEVRWFADALDCPVLGTDISETAEQFENMVVHDFQEPRSEWAGKWDFIYTNSLDHAFNPRKALDIWADQLAPKGRIYIEQTMQHSPAGASEMDPFGVHPMFFPYLVFEWGKGKYRLADILHVDAVKRKGHVWVFVLEREPQAAGEREELLEESRHGASRN